MTQASQLPPRALRAQVSDPAIPRPRRSAVDLEVVIPAYNEARRLGVSLTATADYLAGVPWSTRIVVVDNGSSDATSRVARTAASAAVPVEVIGCSTAGKGAAVRRGMMTSSARFVGFVDADLATPIDALGPAAELLEQGATAVIGSRYATGAAIVRRQPVTRRVGGAAFRALTRRVVPGVSDTQCGFKFFERRAVQRALSGCAVTGFAFDVELLRGVQAQGGTVVELPVNWTDDARSTFRPLRDGLPAFRAALGLLGTNG
ncbi:glycosyl transferase, family 2 [Actinokineospora spheciospongiae]|uniref:Glycosyl transferase, family 2 n=1 Tax=Actinokineospora spheciospongiae TaxID=909613 RepID=W7ISP2_9PSEU|nr:glycosyltransferase [Actinokineospora spheciospongiae]EWC63950.1 glycosyl transferase, family 2 [Actinokineospora spheciospongiae]PWW59547.1 glycosyl transferase family 2 [Actinokineospora spheciospongiae]